jgi:hypothetical protein
MATQNYHNRPSTTVNEFLTKHPEVQLGRASLDKLQTEYCSRETFSIVNKPFQNMVLYQEFDADTKRRVYVVALIDDQRAFDYYAAESEDATAEAGTCDCADHHGPDHLIFDYMVEDKKDCPEHPGAAEPDPDCSACWPVLYGSNCLP